MSRAVPSLFTQPIELLFPTLDIGFSPETFIFFTNEIFSCKQRDFYSCWYFIVARCFLSSTPGKKLIFAEIVSVPNFPFSSTPLLLNVTRKVPPNHFTFSNTPEIQMLTSMFNDLFFFSSLFLPVLTWYKIKTQTVLFLMNFWPKIHPFILFLRKHMISPIISITPNHKRNFSLACFFLCSQSIFVFSTKQKKQTKVWFLLFFYFSIIKYKHYPLKKTLSV